MSKDPKKKNRASSEEKFRTPSPEGDVDASFSVTGTDPPPPPKDPRARAKYNIISRLFFIWVDALFFKGCRRELEQSDLYAHPSEADSEKLNKQFNLYWSQELKRKASGKKPRLWMVMAKSFKWRILLQGILALTEVASLIGQSVLLGELVQYFSSVSTTQFECDALAGDRNLTGTVSQAVDNNTLIRNAYLYALGVLLLAIIVSIVHAHYALIGTKIGMMARIMTTSAVYQKMLSLSQITISDITVGHVINVVSNDVQRFDLAFLLLPFLVIAPLHIVVFTYLVYQEVGWVVFVTIALFVLQIPIQLVLAKIFTRFRFKSAAETDKRVRIMNEVITGIRVIKMYAWENSFKKVVTAIRKYEIHFIKIGGMIRTLTTSFSYGVALTFYMAITFLIYVGTGGQLTPRRVIVTLSLLGFLRQISASFLIRSIFLIFESKVAFARIQNILEKEEMIPDERAAIEEGKKHLDRKVPSQGIFRPESPYIPGTRKITKKEEPIELKSISPTLEDLLTTTDRGSLSPTTSPSEVTTAPPLLDPAPPAVLPAALQNSVIVKDLSASWTNNMDELTLKNISFEVNEKNSFLAVVGKVGSGKSTLLQCLLRELKVLQGSVDINGRVSYVSQTPWVFSGTVRDNILFGLPFDQKRYDEVIDACALKSDIDEFKDGDYTLVGERGVTLSGGQKARVNLARAIYHEADIYLLDDPLSAVDTAVGKQIYDRCIRGLLRRNQVILITHQVQFAVSADQLLVLNDGKVQIYQSKEERRQQGIDQHKLLQILKDEAAVYVYDEINEEEEVDGEEESDEYGTPLMSPARFGSIKDLTYRRILSREDSIDHRRTTGVEESITSLTRQRFTSMRNEDNFMTSLVEPQSYVDGASLYSVPSNTSLNKEATDHPDEVAEAKAQGTISIKTYIKFFFAGTKVAVLFLLLLLFFLSEAGTVAADSWLSEWSNCDITNITLFKACGKHVESLCYLTEGQRMGIYAAITVASIILNFIRSALFYLVCVNASRVLHNRMFGAIIRAPVRFFDTNPSGRVLNRFSKDIGFLDDLLPHVFLEYLFLLVKFLGVLITASVGNPYILIPAFFILVAFVLIRWYYLKTSRDIKRLEAIARSPVYSHFSTTLQGLSTIRTLGKQEEAQELFHKYQNQQTQGWYLYLVTSRWFGLRIDLITALYLGVVSFISVPLAQTLDAGIIGLGLAYTISLAGVLQFCVRQSAEVENIMISTERIMAYSNESPEASLETLPPNNPPPEEWPKKGEIHVNGIQFRYAPKLPYVIKNLKFLVKPCEKVGIVGRTGAGKSSLISILFRLAEPEGEIMMDGVNITTLGLHDLRKKMSIIPQDPVLFSGTMRYNLDPCEEYSDDKLWTALEQVQLKATVKEMSGGLDEEVSEGGSNFSVGQKQLVCLARALLKDNKILILDEATANVDPGTDQIIQKTIRSSFKNCTVLTIAHRLNTIMDSDRIMVMSLGKVVEFDTPYKLLQRATSHFYKMVDKTGPEASRQLHNMVKRPPDEAS